MAPRQIRINAVSPGYTNTEQFNQASIEPSRLAQMIAQVSAGRFGDSSEIATTVEFLLSDAASYLNGQEIVVDGGMTSVQAGV
ncbi:MAG: SDR family oxidoreductase [Lactobacillus sp.]|nr:SDR family oxidoreductase [Lactobacillus sp.]